MGFLPFVSLEFFSPRVEISWAFPLCYYQKFDGYFLMNHEALLGGKVGVNRGEFSNNSGIYHGEIPVLE